MSYQFFPLLFIRFVIPFFVHVGFESFGHKFRIIRLENIDKIVYIGCGQAQRLDFAELRVTRHIGDTVSERRVGSINGLSSPPLLFI